MKTTLWLYSITWWFILKCGRSIARIWSKIPLYGSFQQINFYAMWKLHATISQSQSLLILRLSSSNRRLLYLLLLLALWKSVWGKFMRIKLIRELYKIVMMNVRIYRFLIICEFAIQLGIEWQRKYLVKIQLNILKILGDI